MTDSIAISFSGVEKFSGAFQSALKKLGELIGAKSDEDRLMEKIARGDHSSFEELFNQHSSLVLGYTTRMLGNKEKAEEVSQEVWIKLVKAAPNYRAEAKFRSWLLTMTRNTCLNHLRGPRFEVSMADEGFFEAEADERQSIESLLIESDDIETAKKLIDSLPDGQRTCLVMWMTEDLSYQEIADKLQLNLPAVKSLLYRAKQALAGSIKKIENSGQIS